MHFRVYHDMGKQCTLVQTNEVERKAVFCPGDSTMLFCISVSESRLINLRAYPECSAFCSAVDKHHERSAMASGTKAYNRVAVFLAQFSPMQCAFKSACLCSADSVIAVAAAAAAAATAAAASCHQQPVESDAAASAHVHIFNANHLCFLMFTGQHQPGISEQAPELSNDLISRYSKLIATTWAQQAPGVFPDAVATAYPCPTSSVSCDYRLLQASHPSCGHTCCLTSLLLAKLVRTRCT